MDKKGRAFGLLSGRPNDPTWVSTIQRSTEAFREAKEMIKFPKRQDRRGDFQTIAFGVSYGGGQKVRARTVTLQSKAQHAARNPETYVILLTI